MALLVIGIDFGTSYSGWAFSFRYEFKCDPLRVFTSRWTKNGVSLKGKISIFMFAILPQSVYIRLQLQLYCNYIRVVWFKLDRL